MQSPIRQMLDYYLTQVDVPRNGNSRVRLTLAFTAGLKTTLTAMGEHCSPYVAARILAEAEEIEAESKELAHKLVRDDAERN
jgi:hypothetical protein